MKKKDRERKLTVKDYSLNNGQYLDQEMIHGKNYNFLGNIFKND